jgi:pilus assembly protein CpaF
MEPIEAVGTWDLVKHYLQPIAKYLDMPGVTEILVDRYDKIYIERNGKFEDVPSVFKNNSDLERLIEQIGNALHQQVDRDHFPILDARLPGENGRIKARINAVLPPVATLGACMTIRVFPSQILEAENLITYGSLTQEMLDFLKLAVLCRSNIIVSGGTGSGKTTLINVIASFIPKTLRVITIEDTAELQIRTPYLISMEAPRRKAEVGKDFQPIVMSTLLENALRQSPDSLIVGEIRQENAARSFLQAINTGHDGCMTTLHANSAEDALVRLQGLAVAASHGLPYEAIQAQVRGNIHLLIQQQKIPNQGRRLTEITEIMDSKLRPLWKYDLKTQQHTVIGNVKQSNIMKKAEQYGLLG